MDTEHNKPVSKFLLILLLPYWPIIIVATWFILKPYADAPRNLYGAHKVAWACWIQEWRQGTFNDLVKGLQDEC